MKSAIAAPPGKGVDILQVLGKFAPVIFLLVLMLIFALLEPRFLHPLNLFNVMRQISITGLIAAFSSNVESDPSLSADVKEAVSGNLCRCGTYPKIVRAVRRAASLSRAGTTEPSRG